jgi:hypothetical protein
MNLLHSRAWLSSVRDDQTLRAERCARYVTRDELQLEKGHFCNDSRDPGCGARFEPTATAVVRVTGEDVDLDGTVIPAGQLVTLSTMSAMRDEQAYHRPDMFRATQIPGA